MPAFASTASEGRCGYDIGGTEGGIGYAFGGGIVVEYPWWVGYGYGGGGGGRGSGTLGAPGHPLTMS